MQGKLETVAECCHRTDCVYRSKIEGGIPICVYILVEGVPRGCSISECDKYKSGRKIQPRIKQDYYIEWDWEYYEYGQRDDYCDG